MVEKVGGDQRQVDVAALADGLAAVEGFDDRQIAHFFLQEAGDAEEVFAALASGHPAPGFFVGAAGGSDRFVHVGARAPRDFGMLFPGGRIDRGEIPAGGGFDELAADEEVVAGLDRDVGVNLGGRRVVPASVEAQAAVADGHRGGVGRADRAGGGFLRFFAHGREK
jgi:hypothetical protein